MWSHTFNSLPKLGTAALLRITYGHHEAPCHVHVKQALPMDIMKPLAMHMSSKH
jgi:hypothetical protein